MHEIAAAKLLFPLPLREKDLPFISTVELRAKLSRMSDQIRSGFEGQGTATGAVLRGFAAVDRAIRIREVILTSGLGPT